MASRTTGGGNVRADFERETIGELLRELAEESAGLVRGEVELAKQEMRESIAALRSGVTVLAVAALLGGMAVLVLCSAAVLALAPLLGGGLAALVVAAVLGVGA